MSNLIKHDISIEDWREYHFVNKAGQSVVYKIENPKDLYIRIGGSIHRVVDANGITHCCPAPEKFGCVIVWKSKDKVSF